MPLAYAISESDRALHQAWLVELTQIPTATGKEQRVIAWIRRWASERPELALSEDSAGNLHVSFKSQAPSPAPVYFTAHLDHPAFVVEAVEGDESVGRVRVQFRGGVMDGYFEQARIVIHAANDARFGATLTGRAEAESPLGKSYLAELDAKDAASIKPGDIATWELPPARVSDGLLYTNACDDLAAAAGALAAYDVLLAARRAGAGVGDVRLLFTRAEEIGFVGALAAVKERTIPVGSRVIALENSRSFDDSPIGGGPIVRVGDRLSIFSPSLTGAIAARAEQVVQNSDAGTQKRSDAGSGPTASLRHSVTPSLPWKWQRKLMAGGACEATVFCAYGYEATCVCLPLGNYHNMADLAAVQAGTFKGSPRVGPEFISLADFRGLVDLLVACGMDLPHMPDTRAKVDKLWDERRGVLAS